MEIQNFGNFSQAALPDELRHCAPALVLGLVPAEFLAAALGLGVTSLHARLTRDPSHLPAVTRLPGNRRIFFRVEDVREWIASGTAANQTGLSDCADQIEDVPSDPPRRGRGRPRKLGGTAK